MIDLTQRMIALAERLPLSDRVFGLGAQALVWNAHRILSGDVEVENARFAKQMRGFPVAHGVDEANDQHYELPAAFFGRVLGPRRKYSCCYFESPTAPLEQAERAALDWSVAFADCADGQRFLDLGCGWGSLSLHLAETYPNGHVTAVSNATAQRAFIEVEAARRRLTNLKVVTADMNAFDPGERFDRILSIEMFEHMANWELLLQRLSGWLKPAGRAYIHVFAHKTHAYRFDPANPADWIAQNFFTGGFMPSEGLIRHLDVPFAVERQDRWSGRHYQLTGQAWLDRFNAETSEIRHVLEPVYGEDVELWLQRWRLFFIATRELFAFRGGDVWGVSHYRLSPT